MRKHTAAAKKFYNSKAWKECRKGYIAKVYGLCEICGEPGDILHHKVELNSYNLHDPEITLNHKNLQFVCIEDHNKIHFKKFEKYREDVKFDQDGNLVRV